MSSIAYLLDEHLPDALLLYLQRREPTLMVHRVGQAGMPPKGTPDPDLLGEVERGFWSLVTRDKRSMPDHAADHQAAGGHTWGIFIVRDGFSVPEIGDALLLIWAASEPNDWQDRIEYIPW